MVTDDISFKKYVIQALTDVKYKLNIIIKNQNDERNIYLACKRNEAHEKNEDEGKELASMFPVKNDEELQTLERFLAEEQNRIKLVRYIQHS